MVVSCVLRAQRALTGWPARVGAGLVLGGALGNLLDRLFREGDGFLGGAVVDFVDLQWWPVFNVADAVHRASAPSCWSLTVGRARPAPARVRRP